MEYPNPSPTAFTDAFTDAFSLGSRVFTLSNVKEKCDNMLTIIYALRDPRDNQIRYIGQTRTFPLARLSQHITDATRPGAAKSPKNTWINELIRIGKFPVVDTMEYCDTEDADQKEVQWIKRAIQQGHDLTNVTLLPAPRKQNPQDKTDIMSRYNEPAQRETSIDMIYNWLIQNDTGWDSEQTPSARAIVRAMGGQLSTGSAHKARKLFIKDYKTQEKDDGGPRP